MMKVIRTYVSTAIALVSLAVFSPQMMGQGIRVETQARRTFEFKEAGVRFSNKFSGARLNDCTQVGNSEFRILIRPENTPVNDSAWYAFQVVAREPKTITVTLAYENGKHRYHPKISFDGVKWQPLTAYTHNRDANVATLTLEIGPKPMTVAGQEMIGVKELGLWMSKLARKSFVKKRRVGRSILKQPIEQLEIGETKKRNYVFIVGRQHPPELTGTMGLMQFTETLVGSSALAREYRKQFRTIVIPLMNPDGVQEGHWRHNMNGVDLNRDWKNFLQPETRAVRDLMIKLVEQEGARVFLLLDFHSTQEDVFYTQTDREKTFPENFTPRWLSALQERFPDYHVNRDASYNPGGNTSLVWGYKNFGCPSITYELGDNIDRERIKQLTAAGAEEMMRLLLEAANRNLNGTRTQPAAADVRYSRSSFSVAPHLP